MRHGMMLHYFRGLLDFRAADARYSPARLYYWIFTRYATFGAARYIEHSLAAAAHSGLFAPNKAIFAYATEALIELAALIVALSQK